MEDRMNRVIEQVFDPITSNRILSAKTSAKHVLATMEEDVDDGYSQINWRYAKNRPLMDMVGKIETPFLMLNENFPTIMVERYFDLLKDAGKAVSYTHLRAHET